MLAPASDGAQLIDQLWNGMLAGGIAILLLVVVLAVLAARRGESPVSARRWLIGGGVALPVVVLSALLGEALRIGAALAHSPEPAGMEVEVVARRWWWELRYRDPDGQTQVVLANELHLPMDCVSVLSVNTADVIHSLWIPALAGKVDAIPGQRNQLVMHPTRTGRLRGQCAEYCGTQHANMGLEVVVETPAAFRAWLLNQARPAAATEGDAAKRGEQVFTEMGCATCHRVRGSAASGELGPDLTHVASRRTLAAATLINTAEGLERWLHAAQQVKPGNLMPSLPADIGDADRVALVAYLAGLH